MEAALGAEPLVAVRVDRLTIGVGELVGDHPAAEGIGPSGAEDLEARLLLGSVILKVRSISLTPRAGPGFPGSLLVPARPRTRIVPFAESST